jgi:uncharacterized repeat protein (TIGR03803 family)
MHNPPRHALALAILSVLLAIVARPAQAQTETVLHIFCLDGQSYSCSDGEFPEAGLAGHHGKFYGTTHNGGPFGNGTVFELSPNGNGGWNEKVLYSFTGGADGGNPQSSNVIFDSAGNIYGTAADGGANGYGAVFELSPMGTNWEENVLYSFANGEDGAYPVNGLILDPAGNLYGTTVNAGHGAFVFELSPSGGGWTEQVIYGPVNSGYSGLTRDNAGNIFGISTEVRGRDNNVDRYKAFELSPNGGGWTPTVIHTFRDDIDPLGTPVLDKLGTLYGTTFSGGANGLGMVYRLSHGKKGWTEKILYSFKGYPDDGANPVAGILLDAAGDIYGSTVIGGKYGSNGTVYELVAPVGKDNYKEELLWNFNGTDGSGPDGILVMDRAGDLYGTTSVGGGSSCNNGSGCGVAFKLTR